MPYHWLLRSCAVIPVVPVGWHNRNKILTRHRLDVEFHQTRKSDTNWSSILRCRSDHDFHLFLKICLWCEHKGHERCSASHSAFFHLVKLCSDLVEYHSRKSSSLGRWCYMLARSREIALRELCLKFADKYSNQEIQSCEATVSRVQALVRHSAETCGHHMR